MTTPRPMFQVHVHGPFNIDSLLPVHSLWKGSKLLIILIVVYTIAPLHLRAIIFPLCRVYIASQMKRHSTRIVQFGVAISFLNRGARRSV